MGLRGKLKGVDFTLFLADFMRWKGEKLRQKVGSFRQIGLRLGVFSLYPPTRHRTEDPDVRWTRLAVRTANASTDDGEGPEQRKDDDS